MGVKGGDSGRLTRVESDSEMACQLDDALCRLGEQVFVPLNEHIGASHPESIIGKDLMDHPLPE